MPVPNNVIANADDLGLNQSVNAAIAFCFKQGYINSASLMTNTPGFKGAVALINDNDYIQNIGLHVNLAGGPPLTNLNDNFLDTNGNFDILKTNRKSRLLSAADKIAFAKEIDAQISKALDYRVVLNHLDTHHHIHTIPAFYQLFINAAEKFDLKLRLAQTYREGSYLKYAYRLYINRKICSKGINYSARFETVEQYINTLATANPNALTEVMLHPDFDADGNLTDHYDPGTMYNWLKFLNSAT